MTSSRLYRSFVKPAVTLKPKWRVCFKHFARKCLPCPQTPFSSDIHPAFRVSCEHNIFSVSLTRDKRRKKETFWCRGHKKKPWRENAPFELDSIRQNLRFPVSPDFIHPGDGSVAPKSRRDANKALLCDVYRFQDTRFHTVAICIWKRTPWRAGGPFLIPRFFLFG